MRYPSLYKYVSIERLKGVLINHKVRFTQPSAFNDPFELVPRLWNPRHREPQGRAVPVEFVLYKPRRRIDVDRGAVEDGWCHDTYFRDLRRQLDREIGFLSMSRTWTSLPMWAHYADSFTGAVIEFDGNHEFFEWTFDVHYSEERPIRDLELYWREPIPIAEMCDKSNEWEYEKEVRLARCLSDCTDTKDTKDGFPIYVHDIPPECIKKVIIGERVENRTAFELYCLMEGTDIVGERVSIEGWNYNLRTQPFRTLNALRKNGSSFVAFRNFRDFPNL